MSRKFALNNQPEIIYDNEMSENTDPQTLLFYKWIWERYQKHWKISVPAAFIVSSLLLGVGITGFAVMMALIFGYFGAVMHKLYDRSNTAVNLPVFFAELTKEKLGFYFLSCLAIAFPAQFFPMIFGL